MAAGRRAAHRGAKKAAPADAALRAALFGVAAAAAYGAVQLPAAAAAGAGPLTGAAVDECAARDDGSPHSVCAHAGQRCHDPNVDEGADWECRCPSQQSTVSRGVGEAAVCAVNECAGAGLVCGRAGQLCVEASMSPSRLNDWACDCNTSAGLVGWRRGGAAECHRLVAVTTVIDGDVDKAVVTSPSFIAGFESTLGAATGFEATITDIKQHRSKKWKESHMLLAPDEAKAADATSIEAIVVISRDANTTAIQRGAVVPVEKLASFLNTPAASLRATSAAINVVECGENEYVAEGKCVTCPQGSYSSAGSRADEADTKCIPARCDENERVSGHMCVPCGPGLVSSKWGDPTGGDTECAPPSDPRLAARDAGRRAETQASPPPLTGTTPTGTDSPTTWRDHPQGDNLGTYLHWLLTQCNGANTFNNGIQYINITYDVHNNITGFEDVGLEFDIDDSIHGADCNCTCINAALRPQLATCLDPVSSWVTVPDPLFCQRPNGHPNGSTIPSRHALPLARWVVVEIHTNGSATWDWGETNAPGATGISPPPGPPTENPTSSTPSPTSSTATTPSPTSSTATTPSPTSSTPSPTSSTPSPTSTTPAPTSSTPSPTSTTPSPTSSTSSPTNAACAGAPARCQATCQDAHSHEHFCGGHAHMIGDQCTFFFDGGALNPTGTTNCNDWCSDHQATCVNGILSDGGMFNGECTFLDLGGTHIGCAAARQSINCVCNFVTTTPPPTSSTPAPTANGHVNICAGLSSNTPTGEACELLQQLSLPAGFSFAGVDDQTTSMLQFVVTVDAPSNCLCPCVNGQVSDLIRNALSGLAVEIDVETQTGTDCGTVIPGRKASPLGGRRHAVKVRYATWFARGRCWTRELADEGKFCSASATDKGSRVQLKGCQPTMVAPAGPRNCENARAESFYRVGATSRGSEVEGLSTGWIRQDVRHTGRNTVNSPEDCMKMCADPALDAACTHLSFGKKNSLCIWTQKCPAATAYHGHDEASIWTRADPSRCSVAPSTSPSSAPGITGDSVWLGGMKWRVPDSNELSGTFADPHNSNQKTDMRGMYCVKSAVPKIKCQEGGPDGTHYDGSDCHKLNSVYHDFSFDLPNWQTCGVWCGQTQHCTHFTWAEGNKHCILYHQCPHMVQYGRRLDLTVTTRVMANPAEPIPCAFPFCNLDDFNGMHCSNSPSSNCAIENCAWSDRNNCASNTGLGKQCLPLGCHGIPGTRGATCKSCKGCSQIARLHDTRTVDNCETACYSYSRCAYFTFIAFPDDHATHAGKTDCLLYDSCPSAKTYEAHSATDTFQLDRDWHDREHKRQAKGLAAPEPKPASRCSSVLLPGKCQAEGTLACMRAFVDAGCASVTDGLVPGAQCAEVPAECVSAACEARAQCRRLPECQWERGDCSERSAVPRASWHSCGLHDTPTCPHTGANATGCDDCGAAALRTAGATGADGCGRARHVAVGGRCTECGGHEQPACAQGPPCSAGHIPASGACWAAVTRKSLFTITLRGSYGAAQHRDVLRRVAQDLFAAVQRGTPRPDGCVAPWQCSSAVALHSVCAAGDAQRCLPPPLVAALHADMALWPGAPRAIAMAPGAAAGDGGIDVAVWVTQVLRVRDGSSAAGGAPELVGGGGVAAALRVALTGDASQSPPPTVAGMRVAAVSAGAAEPEAAAGAAAGPAQSVVIVSLISAVAALIGVPSVIWFNRRQVRVGALKEAAPLVSVREQA